ncbi:hypothetical protein [Aliarcobacter butzleri]|uniref:hypothetical protein n=1 Tax=Aliarcobacter butzleri TaxID=28197 RepID=UPI00126A2D6D|nr:hypothetical protein [Aliarcobacter butzleri]
MIKKIKQKIKSFSSFLKLDKKEQEKLLLIEFKKRFLYFIELTEFMIYPIGFFILITLGILIYFSEFTLEYYVKTYLAEIGVGFFMWIILNDLLTYFAISLSKKWDLKLQILREDIKNPYILISIFNFKNMQ